MLLASARLRRAVLPTLGWGKQSTWLAASGSLAHLRARPAPNSGKGGRHHRKASVAAVSALCAAFREGKGKHTGLADFRGCFFYMRKMLPKKPPGRMLT